MKFTIQQLRTLRMLARGDEIGRRDVKKRLVILGLATRHAPRFCPTCKRSWGPEWYEITDAGREALAIVEAESHSPRRRRRRQ